MLKENLLRMDILERQGNKIAATQVMLEILKILNENLTAEVSQEVQHSVGSAAATAVEEFIKANYMENISLDQIAEVLSYNRTYLSEVFKKKRGIGIFEYLRQIRLEHALQELRESEKSVTEIALESGFSSVQVFHRIFSKEIGETLRTYRNRVHS